MDWFEQRVTHQPGVQGGAAVICGTRTPVSTIVAMYPVYGSEVARIVDALPHLTEDDVRAALAYHQRHRAEIDAESEREERAVAALLATVG
ncbi:MAG: DUF433 domain-containing protein [Chloroflexota bacterium]